MDPLSLLAVAQGAMGIGQKIAAGFKKKKAQADFTPYEIPSSINMMLDKANGLASQTEIPGADIYRSRAQSNAAQTVENSQRTAGSTSDVLGTLSGAQQNLDSFYNDIAAKGASFYQDNQRQQQQALQTMGQYETERWRQNEYLPYMQAMGDANAMGQAGNQNIGSAIQSGMSIGAAKWETDNMNNRFDREMEMKYGRPSAITPRPANLSIQPQQGLMPMGGQYSSGEGDWLNAGNTSTYTPYRY